MIRFIAAFSILLFSGCGPSNRDYEQIARSLDLPADVRPICGTPDILGVEVDDIRPGSKSSCGIDDPVKVYAIGSVRLSTPALVNCQAATTLRTWLTEGAQPAARDSRTQITELKIAASYACRSRNSQRGARLSEHAKGNAIDISGFTLEDGTKITVLKNWASGKYAKMLKAFRAKACGPFGTVLGPGSDRFHRDHFHFDVADYRSGPYCR